jgi:antitoxin (DNA-binding transcriptional repressor) of toxin-antitoxin stability system
VLTMRAVGIRILKNKLSSYIRLAAGGETILVTDRDRVVAEITPPRPGRSETLDDAALADAVRNGWVTPPVLRHQVVTGKPVASLRDILDDLDTARSER